MKGFMKGCGIAALIMLVLGLALSIAAGTVIGGAVIAQVVDTVTEGRVSVNLGNMNGWGIQIRDKAGEERTVMIEEEQTAAIEGKRPVAVDVVEEAAGFDSRFEILEGDVERFSLGEEVESLKIEAGGCQFQTEESDDHSFYVETENADRFQAYLEDGVLCIRITTASKSWNDWGKLGTCKVTLYVPEDYHYRDVDIELGAGVLEFEELDADRVSMKVGAGQIVAEDLRADSLEAEIGMGQLELENVYVQGLKADIGMGDLTVEGILDGDVDVSCSMGNVDI